MRQFNRNKAYADHLSCSCSHARRLRDIRVDLGAGLSLADKTWRVLLSAERTDVDGPQSIPNKTFGRNGMRVEKSLCLPGKYTSRLPHVPEASCYSAALVSYINAGELADALS